MREIRQSGSEGGGDETNRLSLPLSRVGSNPVRLKLKLHRLKPDGIQRTGAMIIMWRPKRERLG
jgi:hypothetical protein